MKTCIICNYGPIEPGCITCGTSECQQADYLANLARNARGNKKTLAIRAAITAADLALEARYRRTNRHAY